jgi:hypothetical protein
MVVGVGLLIPVIVQPVTPVSTMQGMAFVPTVISLKTLAADDPLARA